MAQHQYIAKHNKLIPLRHLFQNTRKQITTDGGPQRGPAVIAATSDKVQVFGAIVAVYV
jgi:hypothetical protein